MYHLCGGVELERHSTDYLTYRKPKGLREHSTSEKRLRLKSVYKRGAQNQDVIWLKLNCLNSSLFAVTHMAYTTDKV